MVNIKRIPFVMGLSFMLAGVAVTASCSEDAHAKKKVLPKKISVPGASEEEAFHLAVGSSQKIGYTVSPAKAKNKKVSFATSDKKVLKVTSKGVVKGIKAGDATITIRSKAKKSVTAKIRVCVEDAVKAPEPAEPVSVLAPKLSFAPGDGGVLGDRFDDLLFTGDDDVLVDRFDTFRAAGGTAATGLSLADEEGNPIEEGGTVEMSAGESIRLNAVITPVTSTDKVTWSIDFLGGINVYQTGLVLVTDDTPVDTSATVTVSCRGLKATCKIVVVNGPCEHVWGDWTVSTAPSCMMEGIESSTCGKCGKKRERPVAATGHSFLGKPVTEPTCTEVGETEFTCQVCGETKMEIVRANGHTWAVAGEVLQEPTCTRKGKIKYLCTVEGCDGEKTEQIDALGHTWDEGTITKSPTCIAYGTKEYHCTVEDCTGTKKESLAPTGHTWNYGEITIEPTCEFAGKRVSVCLTCGAKTTANIPANGHDWDIEVVESTCTVRGNEKWTCKTCKAERTKSLALKDHEFESEYRTDVYATCNDVGKKSKHCKNCTYRTEIRIIPALGHIYNDGKDGRPDAGVIDPEPTCVMPGIKTYTCIREVVSESGEPVPGTDGAPTLCGSKKREVVKSLGHMWTVDASGKEVYTTDEPATCTLSGTKSVHCEREGCGATKNTSLIKPLGHDWDESTVEIVEPTCTKEGSKRYTCKREVFDEDGKPAGTCGVRTLEILEPLGHSFDTEWTTDLEPTCAEPGRKSKHCNHSWKNADGVEESCPVQSNVTLLQPKDHVWGTWTTTAAASHGKAGEQKRTCSVCAASQNRAVADGHVIGDDGTCKSCSVSVSTVKTTYEDWEYLVDESDGTVLLKKYTGTKENILIPATMNVEKEDGTMTGEIPCKFAGGYERRTQSGVFASNKKCSIKAVSFEDGVRITDMTNMFYGCSDLETVLHIPAKVTKMDGTFMDCTSLKFVGTLPDGVTELTETFQGCESMVTAPEIPAKVTSLYGTFKGCTSLAASPDLSGLTELTNMGFTFSGCKTVSEAPALPATLTNMTDTFRGTALSQVPEDIPEGVTKLTTTFYGCNSLEFVKDSAFEKLPSSLSEMEYTFKSCKNLTYAPACPKTVKVQVGVFEECDQKVSE